MAYFTADNISVQAELSTGQIITCKTNLIAYGDYCEWHESAPCEWMYGWTESESDIEESSIEPYDPQDFESDLDYMDGAKITKILKVLDDDPDWEVQDGWDEPDPDAAYEEWRDRMYT